MGKVCKAYSLLLLISAVFLTGCAAADNDLKSEDKSIQGTENTPSPEDETISAQIVFEGLDIEGNTVSSEIFSQSKITMVHVPFRFPSMKYPVPRSVYAAADA